jgi:MYXO-CTERM domain-containing protein
LFTVSDMRSPNVAMLLLLAGSLGLGACAAPAAEDDADDQTQNVTGGSNAIESPIAFLFASAAKDIAPTCAGAMLSDKLAVTAKSCAKEGLIIGRAADKDGFGARAKVVKVHLPPNRDADIAVVELDKELKGTNAVITHMPLRGGYAINAFAATDGKGLFSPDKNEASSIDGTMIEETATHGSLLPAKGTEICDGDVGAPVCSSTGGKIGSWNIYGTCGLAGLVVARETPIATTPAPAPAGTPPAAGASTPPADSTTTKCSGRAWKVAQLGQYKEFLAKLAPKAFEPLRIDKPIIRNFPFAPDGLWGYKSKGDVKACKIETTTLAPTAPAGASAKMIAKVSFAGMDKKAAAWGRFGFAKKSEPTKMRWLPAKVMGATAGTAFDTSFEGIVAPEAAGDYVVAFRATANGGETWTSCDTDGIANGYSDEKALQLKVVDPNAPVTPGTTPPKTEETPATPQSDIPPYSDPGSTGGEATEGSPEEGSANPEEDVVPVKKAKDEDSGCSVSTSSPSNRSSSMAIAGVLLGLAAIVRRRRSA